MDLYSSHADPDPTFHVNAGPEMDPDLMLPQVYIYVVKSINFRHFSSLHCFVFLASVIGVQNFNIFYSVLKVYGTVG